MVSRKVPPKPVEASKQSHYLRYRSNGSDRRGLAHGCGWQKALHKNMESTSPSQRNPNPLQSTTGSEQQTLTSPAASTVRYPSRRNPNLHPRLQRPLQHLLRPLFQPASRPLHPSPLLRPARLGPLRTETLREGSHRPHSPGSRRHDLLHRIPPPGTSAPVLDGPLHGRRGNPAILRSRAA